MVKPRRAVPMVFPRAGSSPPSPLRLETALTQVSPTEEGTVDQTYDLYVCHPGITVSTFKARKKSSALALGYGATSIILEASSTFFTDLVASIVSSVGEANAFFHVGAETALNRVEFSAGVSWVAKPSAALGALVAAYYVSTLDPFFNGVFADECQGDLPDEYWTLYKTDNNLNLTDAQRPIWNALWKSNISSFLFGMKAVFQGQKAVVANVGQRTTYSVVDGVSVEAAHIVSQGEVVTKSQFAAQNNLFEKNPWRFRRAGKSVLNIAWDYPMKIPGLVMQGLDEG
jgi:hypothetical protein